MTIVNPRRFLSLQSKIFSFRNVIVLFSFCALIGIAYGLLRVVLEPEANQFVSSTIEFDLEPQFENGDQTRIIKDVANSSIVESGERGFSAIEAMDDVECRLTKGAREAQDLGVLSSHTDGGLAFAVLDQAGTRLSGDLPFRANKIRVGKRVDGSILAGFADLRLNSRVFKARNAAQPIRIYHNNHVIFESEKAWDFDIATNGASFAVHEPAPSGASRLIIRNLNSGKEIHHDLGTRFTPKSDYEKPYALKYSSNNEEIMFEPAYADAMGRGNHWFFPVDQGKPRKILVKDGKAAVFSNSSNMYFVDYASTVPGENRGRSWKISRRELNPTSKEEKVRWERTIDLDHFYGTVVLSPNGRWLALSAWDYTVLRTDNGATKFKFPSAGDNELQLQRLGNILPPDTSIDDMGEVVGSSFIGDHLIFDRKVGSLRACNVSSGSTYVHEEYLSCIRDLRLKGSYRNFQDVFDMNQVAIDGRPISRHEIFRDSPCAEVDTRMHGLRVDDGEIRYSLPI